MHVAIFSVEQLLHHSYQKGSILFFPSSFVTFWRFHPRPVFAMCQRPVGTNPGFWESEPVRPDVTLDSLQVAIDHIADVLVFVSALPHRRQGLTVLSWTLQG
jgi:hypothetical protein